MKLFEIVVFSLLLVSIAIDTSTAARGGGSRGSSSRSSGSRISSSRTSSISRVRYYRGPTYSKGSWKTAAAVGVVFGLMSYKRRNMYYRYPDREPRICYNEDNLRNGTYGYFICPEEDQSDDFDHCCGDEDEQRCCPYADVLAGGQIAGIVVGVIGICAVVGFIVFCVVRKRRQRAKGGTIIMSTNKPGGPHYMAETHPLTSNYNPSTGAVDVSLHGYSSNEQPMGPQQSYDPNVQGVPYAPNPGGPGFYPPPGPGTYPPPGPGTYPPPGPGTYPPPGPGTYPSPGPGFGNQEQYPGAQPFPGAQAPYPGDGQPSPPGFVDGKGPLPSADMSTSYPTAPYNPDGYSPGNYPPTTGPYNVPSVAPPPYSAN